MGKLNAPDVTSDKIGLSIYVHQYLVISLLFLNIVSKFVKPSTICHRLCGCFGGTFKD
jgi:hypothetical protein